MTMYRAVIAGVVILGMCGVSVRGAVSEHVFAIEMSKTYNYKHTSGATYRYQFDAAVQADDSVSSIVMTTPGGGDYTLILEVEDGERWFNHHVDSSNEADLAPYTAGTYTFTVNYAAGGSEPTTVAYTLANGDPIPPVTQQPILTYPSDGATGILVPLTFEYEAPTDPAWTAGLEWEAATGSDNGSVEELPSSVSSYGPVALNPNTEYELSMTIGHAVWGTNPDGIPTVVDTDAEELFTFTTGGYVLWPLHVGKRYYYTRRDSNDPQGWPMYYEFTERASIDSREYFQLQVWNYENDSATENAGYVRSTEDALYMYNPDGEEFLEFQKAPVGTQWTVYQERDGDLDYKVIEIVAIEPVTTPYGTFAEAYKHRRFRCVNPDDLNQGSSPDWYEWIVPGVGMVKEEDHWTDYPPAIQELTSIDTIDIDWICITAAKTHRVGIPTGTHPWFFEIWVHFNDLGSVHHTDVTKPGGSTPFATIYGDGDYDPPERYASLAELRVEYPLGTYTFEFRDAADTILRTVNLDYSGLPGEPGNPVHFTYPSTDGQTGVDLFPTLTWTVASGDGDALMMGLEDWTADQDIGGAAPVPITTSAWAPGPLQPGHEHNFEVSVCRVKDWVGPDWPTMTVEEDEFRYSLMTEYLNEITFTAGTTLFDCSGDGLVSIVGDVPCFVECVYFGRDCPPVDVLDCNGDGLLSIVGDVPCFVDCVYFENCPK